MANEMEISAAVWAHVSRKGLLCLIMHKKETLAVHVAIPLSSFSLMHLQFKHTSVW